MNNEIYVKCMIATFGLLILGFIWYAINGILTFDPFKTIVSIGFVWIFYRAIKNLRNKK